MEKNKYIEALDTLIRCYYGKIAELEKMKLDAISESTEELETMYYRGEVKFGFDIDIVRYEYDPIQNRTVVVRRKRQ